MEYKAAYKTNEFRLYLERMNLGSTVVSNKIKFQETTTVKCHFYRAQKQAKLTSILFMHTHKHINT